MSGQGFTHLHLHSQYSLLDGAVTFEKLFERCKRLDMNAVAVTDHGNMFGAVEFYTKAKDAGIKPILGIEAYLAPGSRLDRTKTSISDAAYHLLLLAENNTGYQNLLKLASTGYLDGFYYRPRIDKEILAECHEGIICATACLKGEVTAAAANGDLKAARQAAESYLKIFGPERFFIEVQRHQSDGPDPTAALIDLANELGVGLIATNDVHFLAAEDHEAHNCLCAISTGKHADDPDRMIYPPDVYLKSSAEMRQLFPEAPQACDNTSAIAQRCHVELDLKTRHAPRFRPPDGSTPEDYLHRLCLEGVTWRYGEMTPQIQERLDRELQVIQSKGFSSYFLIVWDFCNHARAHSIPVGARGSGVGTIVGYCLGLCDVDPLRYGLLFERFMDPARSEMPDIDIDMCQARRQDVIDYVRKKYGHVAQIITYGTMKAKAVIRDVCRVLAVPLAEADRLAKLVPFSLDMTLDKALETEPELKQAYDTNELTRRVIDIGRKLEGLARHASVHAAGVVIADEPLTNFVPLYKPPGTEDIITQYEGPVVEKVGLLKMDFLGLKTLSVLERARQLVQQKHGVDIDLEKLDLHDAKTFKIFAEGRTKGVFQFESGGMQDLLMKMKPDRIEDLIAANALYRPGPMILIPDYIDRKHGAKWSLPHPIMTEVLQETYGIMCIHEDTRIAMADGTEKPIRDVRIGDSVHSLNRATAQFEAKPCHGCGPTRRGDGVKITLENGFSVTLTDDHRVYTFDGMKEAGQLDPACDLVAVAIEVPSCTGTVTFEQDRLAGKGEKQGWQRQAESSELAAGVGVHPTSPRQGLRKASGLAAATPRKPCNQRTRRATLAGVVDCKPPAVLEAWEPSDEEKSPMEVVCTAHPTYCGQVERQDTTVLRPLPCYWPKAANAGGSGAEPLRSEIDLLDLGYYRIAAIERVHDQQFYGMSVADHHNLVANGIVVKNCYQEQVMQVCNRLGDIPLREAYALIKAISKKKASIIQKEKERFLGGCVSKGMDKAEAEQIFELIERFAGYGFNKSHSTRYAFVAYQTAYMKAHWPVEFMAALLTYEMGDTEKIVEYIAECQGMGVEVMAPDINDSDVDFTPLYKETGQGNKGVIRFGLAAVKGVGEKAVEHMIEARRRSGRFQSLFHFCENVDLRAVNKQVIEALIKGGAFDRLGGNRNQMMTALERAMEVGASLQSDKVSGQMNFFGQMTQEMDYAQDHTQLPDVPPWPEMQMLTFEKQVLGFYVTSNPLSQHAEAINDYSTTNTAQLAQSTGRSNGQGNGYGNGNGGSEKIVMVGGMITKIRYNLTKTGRNAGSKMAVFTLEDLQGQIEVVLFPDVLGELAPLLIEDTVVFVKGKVDYRRERPNIIAAEMIPIDQAREKLAKGVRIRLDAREVTQEKMMQIRSLCQYHKGNRPLSVVIQTDKGRVYAAADRALSVNPDVEFCRKMRQLVGEENFALAK
ncbi:MAG: DNA polymerase III subunit alpha [Planctomycetes bacterium]|jgi:DNA polymerase III alpha subunit|nr:DNA polymerase III subunit alpha [Planctomycetota bacterium]